jgi:tetratricopeptide (TPR) repeat protein
MASYKKIRKVKKKSKNSFLRQDDDYITLIDSHSQKSVKIEKKYSNKKSAIEKLDSITKLKEKIINRFNSQKINQGYRLLAYLKENQHNTKELLCKSLCDISNFIKDKEIALSILKDANELRVIDQVALSSYGKALADSGKYEEAFKMFQHCIDSFGEDEVALSSYGKALADSGKYEKAFKMFERCLDSFGENEVALSSYGKALADSGKYEEAFKMFERCLDSFGENEVALSSYGKALADSGKYEEAFKMFQRCLDSFGENEVALNSYGIALADCGRYEEAFNMFQRRIDSFGQNEVVLNSYGKALADSGRYEEAFKMFQRCLDCFGENEVALSSYGKALADSGRYEEAFKMFERCLDSFGENEVALSSYGKALADSGKYEEAFNMFERCLETFAEDEVALNSYGKALADSGKYEEAFEIFERCLKLNPEDQITLFLYGLALEKVGRYEEAANKIDTIINSKNYELDRIEKNYFNFTLGRLYYYNKQQTLGDKYFQLAIDNSSDENKALLEAAKMILSRSPFSKKASDMLLKITEASRQYVPALKLLSLNLPREKYFYHFFDEEQESKLKSQKELYRHIIHKIENQTSIMRLQIEEIISDNPELMEQDSSETNELNNIRKKIYNILEEMKSEKNKKDKVFNELEKNDYGKILSEISNLSHDITDKISNGLFTVRSAVMALLESCKDSQINNSLIRLQKHIEASIQTLNNLKSINEGIALNYKPFKINELFASLQDGLKLRNATVNLEIYRGSELFCGDKAKITEIINELIENSIRHNEEKQIQITITASIVNNPHILENEYHGNFLQIMLFDDGKGIPKEKKNWIFLPLNTTSKQGSGLGLFIIKKTLEEMDGFIWENGVQGVRFNIFIKNKEIT